MKLAIIIAAVLVVVAGGAAAFLLLSEEQQEDTVQGMINTPDPQFLELGYLSVPVFQDDKVSHRVEIEIYLDLDPEADLKSLKNEMPRIRDSVYSELYALYNMHYVNQLRNVLPLIKRRVQQVTNRAVGRSVVADVLVQDFYKQKLRSFQKVPFSMRADNSITRERVSGIPHSVQ